MAKSENARPAKRPSVVGKLLGATLLLLPFPVAAIGYPIIIQDAHPICIFRIVTGKPCPFCGMTRAFAYATHGQFSMAMSMNPLWWLAAAGFVGFATLLIIDAMRSSHLAFTVGQKVGQRYSWWLTAMVFFEIWRLYAGR